MEVLVESLVMGCLRHRDSGVGNMVVEQGEEEVDGEDDLESP